ncbi:MAG TPA: hypothetical protein VL996_01635 [Methylocella sp.]|nr:hypothetical protein [Methylocella sp.]
MTGGIQSFQLAINGKESVMRPAVDLQTQPIFVRIAAVSPKAIRTSPASPSASSGVRRKPAAVNLLLSRLGSHLDQLVAHGFLASYRITKAKADNQTGFVIAFRPGDRFFRDYDRYYRARLQGELQWDYSSDQRQIAEPLRVAYQFIEKRTGQKITAQAYVSSKDVETAKLLLTELVYEDIPSFLDYAFAEARRTNFDMQTLGGVRQYLTGYQAAKAAQKAVRAREDSAPLLHDMRSRRFSTKSLFGGTFFLTPLSLQGANQNRLRGCYRGKRTNDASADQEARRRTRTATGDRKG